MERSRRRRAVGTGLGTLATVGGVGLLLFLLPLTGAAGTGTTFHAPFKGMGVVPSTISRTAGCGKATTAKASFFNATTGMGGFSSSASVSKSCASFLPGDSGVAYGQFELTFPVNVSTTSSTHSISVIWSTIINGSVKLTLGTCKTNASVILSYCDQVASAYVHGFATLVDLTNGSRVKSVMWPGNFTTQETNRSCVFGVCTTNTTGTGSGSSKIVGTFLWSWTWSKVTMNRTHAYFLDMVLYGGATAALNVWDATITGGSASASLNSATAGNIEKLTSITVK